MPSDYGLKAMNALHRIVLTVSFGRLGWSAFGMPVLELTTTGRKSGAPRKVMLTSPLQLGDTLAIVASRGGDDRHPAWFLNLRDHPAVTVTMNGKSRPMQARIATPEEKAELWPRLTTDHKNYAGYQSKTQRDIPLVLLAPTS
jgi:deazaflavin-dependent oxidoreductase (nitroreductase family)